MPRFVVMCPGCGEEDVALVAGCDGVLECLDCGEFFEDDQFDLPVKKRRQEWDDREE